MECKHCSDGKNPLRRNCIETVPIFNNLTEEEIMEISMITRGENYQKGEFIFLAGQKNERLYVIHHGKVKISRISETGKEQIIRILGPGDFMGELSLFTSTSLNSNAEALEPTAICIMDGSKLKQIINQRPNIAIKIIHELSYRLQGAEDLIESLGIHDVEKRIADSLLRMAKDTNEVILEMSKKDLASHIGMSQETLSRKLSFFQEMGWIQQTGHRKILILEKQSLSDIAGI